MKIFSKSARSNTKQAAASGNSIKKSLCFDLIVYSCCWPQVTCMSGQVLLTTGVSQAEIDQELDGRLYSYVALVEVPRSRGRTRLDPLPALCLEVHSAGSGQRTTKAAAPAVSPEVVGAPSQSAAATGCQWLVAGSWLLHPTAEAGRNDSSCVKLPARGHLGFRFRARLNRLAMPG